MKQTQGGYAVGDRFWDREEDLRFFEEKVDEGKHLLLVAQRRMGKTSLMHEAARRLSKHYLHLYVDLQEAFEAPDAIVKLSLATREHDSLWGKTWALLGNAVGAVVDKVDSLAVGELSVSLRAGLTAGNWAAKGDALLATLAASDKPVLLLLDEVPIMVNRMLKGQDYTITPERKQATDAFMSWLRKNSIEHQGKIRIVLSGSIGLEPVLHQAGMSAHLSTFVPFELRPWEPKVAVGCLDALAAEYGIEFPDGAQSEMVERIECCIPDHVQMFFGHARDWCVRNGKSQSLKEDVEEVYDNEMLGFRGHAELTHYEERLKTVLGLEPFPLAIEMLTEAAAPGAVLTPEALEALQRSYTFEDCSAVEMQKEILYVLEHDGYLRPAKGGYVFVSRVVRDWWHKRHGLFFKPVLQRKGKA